MARFVSPATVGGPGQPAPVFVRRFNLDTDPVAARLYITAHGIFVARLNGERVGDEVLAPGWTSYRHRLPYLAYDVTSLLRRGPNELDVLVGNGWFRGRLGFTGERNHYGDRLALLAQLEVVGANGSRSGVVSGEADGAATTRTVIATDEADGVDVSRTLIATDDDARVEEGRTVIATDEDARVVGDRTVIATDERWTVANSRIVADDLYDGQVTDLRLPAVSEPCDDVVVLDEPLERLVSPPGPPVRVTGSIPAVAVDVRHDGRVVADFGQNVVGWVRGRVRDTSAGDEVVVRHAEVLLPDGELALAPLRSAEATDTYVLAGTSEDAPEERLEPELTFHGFRYAELSSSSGRLAPSHLEAVVVGSDLERTGWFECSDPDLNRLHENVVWSMRGNFLAVPTDCPQRDERLGWTADIQLFAPTACFLFDCAGFLQSWLADLAAEQRDDGTVPLVVPDVVGLGVSPAGWGDAAVVVPWTLYERYGDTGILEAQLDSMRRAVDAAARDVGPSGVITGGFQFGDWLDPDAPADEPWAAKTDPGVLATALLVRSAGLLAKAAEVVGEEAAARRYGDLAEQTRVAFQREFVTANGRVASDSATAYAMAIAWDLLDQAQRRLAGRRLADQVRAAGFRIPTGFFGTPLIQDALCTTGEQQVAHRLLFQRACPSWLYPVTMGATTMWERWDSMLPDGSLNPGSMTSFNHYALGAVADWLHRSVAGLAPLAPGYRRVLVRPVPPDELDHARARHRSPYGDISVGWHRQSGRLTLDVTLPPGTSAQVHVPGRAEPVEVTAGTHRWETDDPRTQSPALPADATVRDLLDHPQAFAELTALLVEENIARDEPHATKLLAPFFDHPAATFDGVMPAAILAGALSATPKIQALITHHLP